MAQPGLRRALGTTDVVLFFVTAVLSIRWLGTAAAAGPSSLVVWGIALVTFFLPLAFTTLELTSRFPDEGGIYVWSREAFGERAGFLTGWLYWASNLVYFPALLYFGAEALLHLRRDTAAAGPGYFVAASLGGLAIATALNVVGLDVGKWLNNVAAVATWVPVAILVAAGAVAGRATGWTGGFHLADLVPRRGFQEVVFWSTIAFAFAGVEAGSLMGEEIRDARRTVPRAILVAGAIITAVYVAGTAAILLLLPGRDVSSLGGFMDAVGAGADRLGLGGTRPLVAVLVAVSSLGGVGAWLGSTARLPFVAGVDHALPPAFARLHPRWGTPWVALLTQAGLAAVFVVLGQAGTSVRGAYDVLVSLGVISYFIPYLFMFAAMIRLQRRPAGPDVRRVPGGRPVAIVLAVAGLATTAISIALALVPPPDEPHPWRAAAKIVGGTALLVAAGLLLSSRRTTAAEGPG